jgi:adenine/guanine phosphoribosyltransferase-like PRPP-binding protein
MVSAMLHESFVLARKDQSSLSGEYVDHTHASYDLTGLGLIHGNYISIDA